MNELFQGDKSTVISIVPFQVGPEFKPGLYPGMFTVPPCLNDAEPSTLIINSSLHLMHIGGQKQPIRMETASYQIAKSIVDDFIAAQLFTDSDAKPGIMWLHGVVTPTEFVKKNVEHLAQLKAQQKNWFIRLIRETDDEWAKTKSHKVVSPQAKLAAQILNVRPDWFVMEDMATNFVKCPACSTVNDPTNAVCTNCRCVLNEEKFKKLTFAK